MALLLVTSGLLRGQQQPFAERVDVRRVLIDARVVDDVGRPVLGLEPADFEVKIGGKLVRVESVEWIGGEVSQGNPLPSTGLVGAIEPGSRGRLIVLLIQKSLERGRIVGLMRLLQLTEPLLAGLTPDDRFAVLSFDSHLKIWLDFTGDVDRVRTLLAEDILLRHASSVEPVPGPSLLSRLSPERGRKAYTIEEALRLLGNALEPLPGSKAVILLGYGFGRFSTGGVILMDGYDEASAALQRARVTVFSLDVTEADYHSLEKALKAVAADTGGFFARTHLFPSQAIDRVVHALVGHYVLFVDKPELQPGMHPITVQLTEHQGTVLARTTYVP